MSSPKPTIVPQPPTVSNVAQSLDDVAAIVNRMESELKKSQRDMKQLFQAPTTIATLTIVEKPLSPAVSARGPAVVPTSPMSAEFHRMPVMIGQSRKNRLKDPATCIGGKYVRAQLEALRYSAANNLQYHQSFDTMCVARQRALLEEKLMSAHDAHTDYVTRNIEQQAGDSVFNRLTKSMLNEQLKGEVIKLPRKEKMDFMESQLEVRRDLYAAQEAARQKRRAEWDEFKKKRDAAGGELVAPAPVKHKHEEKTYSDENAMMEEVSSLWLTIVFAANHFAVFRDVMEQHWISKRKEEEEAFQKRLMGTSSNQTALVSLAIVRDKHRLCRKVLHRYVIAKLKQKHGGPSLCSSCS